MQTKRSSMLSGAGRDMFSEISGELPDVLGDFTPGSVCSDRAIWNSVPQTVRERVIRDAEETLARAFPLITASDYREFTATGNRSRFEELYFARRRMLNNLVLGELVEGRTRFLPGIVDGIFLIAEESGWQLPAHNAYERSGARLPLPDNSQPVVDLFAAETAALLATAVALLGDALDGFSPEITARVEREIQIRILSPYLGRHFWWMGRGEERMNNWTAWISQNVLLTVFSLKTDQPARRAVVEKALGSLDAFLKDYAEDGACEEGVLYYRHAALCLHGALTILDGVAPGLFGKLWQQPKIRLVVETEHTFGKSGFRDRVAELHDKLFKNGIFTRRQLQRFACDEKLPRSTGEAQIADGDLGGCPILTAANHRTDPRLEFGDFEGLGEIVVGTAVEPRHTTVQARIRSQDDDRQLVSGPPQSFQERQAIKLGQRQVEDHRGILRHLEHVLRILAIVGNIDSILRLSQGFPQPGRQILVVLHHKQSHPTSLACAECLAEAHPWGHKLRGRAAGSGLSSAATATSRSTAPGTSVPQISIWVSAGKGEASSALISPCNSTHSTIQGSMEKL